MNINSFLEASDIDSADFDALVYTAASAMATRRNNLGIEQQLSFLNEHYGDDVQILKYIVSVNAANPMIITTSAPLGDDSDFSEPFSGKLVSLDDSFVTVLNESGESIDVLYPEIASFKLTDLS